jgi:hypothetical protein
MGSVHGGRQMDRFDKGREGLVARLRTRLMSAP